MNLLSCHLCSMNHSFLFVFLQANDKCIPLYHSIRFLLCLLCIRCGQSARSYCTLFRQIRYSCVFINNFNTDDFIEFSEKFKVFNASVVICIDFNCYRYRDYIPLHASRSTAYGHSERIRIMVTATIVFWYGYLCI